MNKEILDKVYLYPELVEYCDFGYEEHSEFTLHVINGMDKEYVIIIPEHFSTPDRLWINEDGDVFTASGQDDPFLPTIEINNGRWYCGDEIHYVSKEHVFNYGEHWHTSMCIPKVKEYQIKKESYEYLIERFKKMFPDSPLSDA